MAAKKAAPTLGSLLPPSQAKLLTAAAKGLTKKQLEAALNKHPKSTLSHKDLGSIRKLMIARINGGQSAFTWSSHNLSDRDKDPQEPSTCVCL